MNWFCSFFFICIAIFGRLIKGRWSNLLTVFSGYYGITILFANLRLYGLLSASDKTAFIFVLGMFSFLLGYLLVVAVWEYQGKKKTTTRFNNENFLFKNRNTSLYSTRNGFVLVLSLFVVFYSTYRLYNTVQLLKSGYLYNQIRTIYFNSNEIFKEGGAARYGRNRLDVYAFQPALSALTFLTVSSYFSDFTFFDERYKKYLLIITCISILFTAISNGGREIIYYTLLIVFFMLANTQKNSDRLKELFQEYRPAILFLSAISIVFLVLIGSNRTKSGETNFEAFIKMVYIYMTGYFPNASIRFAMLNSEDYTYGYTFLLGLFKIFIVGFHTIFGIPYTKAFSLADTITTRLQVRIDIGGGNLFNAYVSPFYYFFMDFGYLSLIVEALLFGLFCAIVEINFENRRDALDMFMYIFAFYLVISSMVRWEMVHPKTAMILYFVFLIFKRNDSSKQKGNKKRVLGYWD